MKMTRKLMLGTAIAAVMASGSAFADNHAHDEASKGGIADSLTNGSYVAVSVGMGDMGLSDDAVVGTLTYGRDLDSIASKIGIPTNLGYEVELTGTLADAEQDLFGGSTADASYMGAGVYLTYGYNLGKHMGVQDLDVYGKAGVSYVDAEIETAAGTFEDDNTDVGFGVGINYNLKALTGQENVGVRAEFLDNGSYDEIKVGVSYAF